MRARWKQMDTFGRLAQILMVVSFASIIASGWYPVLNFVPVGCAMLIVGCISISTYRNIRQTVKALRHRYHIIEVVALADVDLDQLPGEVQEDVKIAIAYERLRH